MAGPATGQDTLIAKLSTRAVLAEEDRQAIRDLPCIHRSFAAQKYMMREGSRPSKCAFLLDGFAFRHKLAADGGRQIVGLLIPGDFTDLEQLFLNEADHNVQSLTRLEVAELDRTELRKLATARPAIGQALWIDALVEASIARETILNIGRRDGPTRLAPLLCEFEARLSAAGLAKHGFELPMTQEQIGDATGMTAVHVNRTLRQLERESLISRDRRRLKIEDWPGLQHRADFNPLYLHLDQGAAA